MALAHIRVIALVIMIIALMSQPHGDNRGIDLKKRLFSLTTTHFHR
jgi:hypothetical protein